MPVTPSFTRRFRLTAKRANGIPMPGATFRLLTAAGLDVTHTLLLDLAPVTNAYGIIERTFTINQLTPGVHTLELKAPGFQTWHMDTNALFSGSGDFVATLTRSPYADDYTLTEPAASAVSSMAPIVYTVESTAVGYEWELIKVNVEHPDGRNSGLEAPVDKANNQAILDIRNRVFLGVRPLLIGDGTLTRPDTDFSTTVDLSFASVTDEAETEVEAVASIRVAASLPPKGASDLMTYVSAANRKWMVPAEPVVAFRGYYRDVMIWLTQSVAFTLTTTYYNGAGAIVTTTTASLTSSPNVQRIRLNTNPDPLVTRAVLFISAAGQSPPATQPLTVLYRD